MLVGRCSQDEGAPPLWPWAAVLGGLGRSLPTEAGTADEGTRFRTWDDIVRTVQDAAGDETLLVLLDDLHWADASSLRVLGLLLETVHEGRLLLVATWRDKPQPTGALGAVAEQLSRRHGLRLHLSGLDAGEVSEIVESVAHLRPSEVQADALRARTDGNPFFLLEYARLVGHDGDLATLLAEENPPHGVADVVTRRLDRLPDDARTTLVTAAVVGRHFDLTTVAAAAGTDEDDVLDALEAASEVGLVREDGVGRFRFAHALVRDTVYAGTSPTRRARWHARVAEALAGAPGREGEVARHWHSAGPGHEERAWRADRAAAREALRLHAYEEAIEFLTSALVALAEDPAATARDEYDVLVDLATADKASGDWINLRPVVHRAIAVAGQLGDDEALARVALMTSTDALWQSAHHGQVDDVIVDGAAPLPGRDAHRRRRAPLPGDARAGRRALLRRHAARAGRPRRGGRRHGPADRRPRPGHARLPQRVRVHLAPGDRRYSGPPSPTRPSRWPRSSATDRRSPTHRPSVPWPRPSSATSTFSSPWRPRPGSEPRSSAASTRLSCWTAWRSRGTRCAGSSTGPRSSRPTSRPPATRWASRSRATPSPAPSSPPGCGVAGTTSCWRSWNR